MIDVGAEVVGPKGARGRVVRILGRWTVLVEWACGTRAPASWYGSEQEEHEEHEHRTGTSEG